MCDVAQSDHHYIHLTIMHPTSHKLYTTPKLCTFSLPLSPAESFIEETSMVQLQLLTATVKLFLKQPETSQVGLSLTNIYK